MRRNRRSGTYVALVVHLVVGEFDAVEADHLPHPRLSGTRRVRVHVEARRDTRVVSVSSHHPLRAVVHVPVGPEDNQKISNKSDKSSS